MEKGSPMVYLTLENLTPNVNVSARTDIMRLITHKAKEETEREPKKRAQKPLERVPNGVCSAPTAPCPLNKRIGVIDEDVKAGKRFPVFTTTPPDLSAVYDFHITFT